MSDPTKRTNREELRRIEDAWIESILQASGDELRAEIREAGDDPDAYIALADRMLASAQEQCGRERLERAKAEVAAFRARASRTVLAFDEAKARTEAEGGEADSSPMMLAARKGKALSERDEDAVRKAKAKLKRLESEDEAE